MKIQRPGNTESHLLMQNFLKTYYPEDYNSNTEYLFIRWLYSTSGFYDKSVNLTDIPSIVNSNCYQRWIKEYEQSLYNCDYIESYIRTPPKYVEQYFLNFNAQSLNINHKYIKKSNISWQRYWCIEGKDTNNNYKGVFSKHYSLLENKKVLVISAFADLIEYQYKYNIHKIFKDFPKFDILTITTPYTFLNNGPHNNFFETLEILYDKISVLDFDIALLSCGTYAAILIDKIHEINKRDAIYMGRGCNPMFGIDPSKDPEIFKYWITTIPDQYIPKDYEKIENGIYWVSKNKK